MGRACGDSANCKTLKMDYRTFKKTAKNLNLFSKGDLKRALKIAKKLDDNQRVSFLEELEEKCQMLNEVVEKTSSFVEDYSEFVTNAEKIVHKVERKDQEEQEHESEVSEAEKHLSDYTQT